MFCGKNLFVISILILISTLGCKQKETVVTTDSLPKKVEPVVLPIVNPIVVPVDVITPEPIVNPEPKPIREAILYVTQNCFPCRKAKEIIKKLKEEGYIVKIIENGKDIVAYPTLVIIENGKEIIRKVGLQTESSYRQLIPKI